MERRHQIRVPILDLGCGGAGSGDLERILIATHGVLAARVNPATEIAYVDVDAAELDAWSLARAIARAGFAPGRPQER
jgi:hypothetical protein